ncbi:hypothetical protein HDV00_008139 [Rhizophlyctis rosea]|nr:hypothetical protein HDV00_008139 [Rhizophlyctis rosea]
MFDSHKESTMALHVASDGVVYKDDVKRMFTASPSQDESTTSGKNKAVLILVPLRLGLDNLNPVYHSALKASRALLSANIEQHLMFMLHFKCRNVFPFHSASV